MIRIWNLEDKVSVPVWATDLESFRRWTEAADFPEKGNIGYLNGEVWVDMSKEQVFTHVLVKTRSLPASSTVSSLIRSPESTCRMVCS